MFAQLILLAQAVAGPTGTAPSQDDIDAYKDDRAQEAGRLAGAAKLPETKGLAERSGETLTLSWHGKPVATLSDVRPYDCMHAGQPCTVWSFASVLMLRPDPYAPPEPYATVLYSPGVGGKMAIVDHDGRLIWMDFTITAKGRYVASGSFQGIEMPAHFLILDWASPGHAAAWSSDKACEPIKWMSEYNLAAVCNIPGQKLAVAGRFRPLYNGNWSFIPSGWMDGINVSRSRTGERYNIIKGKTPLPAGFELKSVGYDSLMSANPGTVPGEEVLGYRKLD